MFAHYQIALSLILLIAVTTTNGIPKGHHKTGSPDDGSAAANSGEVGGSSDNAASTIQSGDASSSSDDSTGSNIDSLTVVEVSAGSGGIDLDDNPPEAGELVGPLPPPPLEEKKSCIGIVCDAPPVVPGGQCRATNGEKQLNPIIPIVGSNADCCPVHICTRPDGSQFTHYGIQTETSSGFTTSTGYLSSSGPAPPPPFYLMGPPPGFLPPPQQGPPSLQQFRYYQQQQSQMPYPPQGFIPPGGNFYNRPFLLPPPQPRLQPLIFPQPPPQFNFVPFYGLPNNGPNGGPPGIPYPIEQRGGGPFLPNSNRVNRSPYQPGGASSYSLPGVYSPWETGASSSSGVGIGIFNTRVRRLAQEPGQQQIYH